MQKSHKHLLEIYQAALNAVTGEVAVRQEISLDKYPDVFHVVAIGKAADSMAQGIAPEKIISGLLITKQGHVSEKLKNTSKFHCIEAGHPIPDQASLKAGQALLDYLKYLPRNETCLFLISGGASALVEVLVEGWSLLRLKELNEYLLAHHYSIDEINAVRRCVSKIKGGGLWLYLGNRPVICLMISDVPNDDPAVIGSGLLFPPENVELPKLPMKWSSIISSPNQYVMADNFIWKIVASLLDAKNAAAKRARELGYQVNVVDEFLGGDAEEAAKMCVKTVQEQPGTLFIWGGETTVNLPENAGIGGRNQHLALKTALEMSSLSDSEAIYLLAAGTDGSDGTSTATGAIVDEQTVRNAAQQNLDARDYLNRADSNSFFQKTNEVIVTGATGTNVMDLVLGIKLT